MTEPRYMSLETLASTLDVGESTIESWVAQGKFPAPKRIGPNGMRRWSWAEVQMRKEVVPHDRSYPRNDTRPRPATSLAGAEREDLRLDVLKACLDQVDRVDEFWRERGK